MLLLPVPLLLLQGSVLLSLILCLQLGSLDLVHGSYLGQTPGQGTSPSHLQDSMAQSVGAEDHLEIIGCQWLQSMFQSVRADDANGCRNAAFFMRGQGRAGQGKSVAMCKGSSNQSLGPATTNLEDSAISDRYPNTALII